jgi:hypothetical protein
MVDIRKPNRKGAEADYGVGYRKPPRNSRFQRGRSGNPKGRPKGVSNFKTDLRATLEAAVRVTQDGKPRKKSTQEAMLLRLREKALGGDSRALDRLILLAQTYNDEDLTVSSSLSTDDADLLQIYRTRVLSGAAGLPDSIKGPDGPTRGRRSSGTTALANSLKQRNSKKPG